MANKRKPTDTLEFYVGIVLIFAGLFFLLSKAVVRSSWVNSYTTYVWCSMAFL